MADFRALLFRRAVPGVVAAATLAFLLPAFAAAQSPAATPTSTATMTGTPSPGTPVAGTPSASPTTSTTATATPSPAGTPWPAPTGLAVTNGPDKILNDDNSFIPPDKRVYRTSAMWEVASGFTGMYEVEMARQYRGETDLAWVPVGTRQASDAVDGRLSVSENTTFSDYLNARFCFRVRTVIQTGTRFPPGSDVAALVVERGPWAEGCTQFAPTSGGGATVTPRPPVDSGPGPFPPDTGSGYSAGGSTPALWLGAVALLGGGVLLASSVHLGGRKTRDGD